MTKPIIISMFNHKGGVGKTTSVYNIGYILSVNLGLRVLMVDGDPQCNLTGIILSDTFKDSNQAREFYANALKKSTQENPEFITIGDCFRPLLKQGETFSIDRAEKITPTPVHDYKNLFFIPGHLDLSEMDHHVELGLSAGSGQSLALYRWIPGMLTNLFRKVAEKHQIDVILFDLSPSLGGMNQSILMGSDYYMVPFFPDFFSFQAVNSLAQKFLQWLKDDSRFEPFRKMSPGDPKYIRANPLFLGGFPQKTRIRKKTNQQTYVPEQAYGVWIKDIYSELEKFVSNLKLNFEEGKGLSKHFVLNKIAGINDFISAGLDVQASGRPICDQQFDHKHQNDKGKLIKFTKDQNTQKFNTSQAYIKLLGAMFTNMSQQDLDLLGKDFKERVGLYSATSEQTDLSELIPIPQSPAPTPSQDTHWYSDDEINTLLQHHLNHQQNLQLLDAISATRLHGNTFRDNLQDFKRQREQENERAKDRVILPLNLDNSHWVLLYIRYPSTTSSNPALNEPEFFYFDPLGAPPSVVLMNNIRYVYPDAEIHNLDCRVQTDGFNCGPWIIEAARTIVEGAGLPEQDMDINQIREHHRAITHVDIQQEEHNSSRTKRRRDDEGSSSRVLKKITAQQDSASSTQEDQDSQDELTDNNQSQEQSRSPSPVSRAASPEIY